MKYKSNYLKSKPDFVVPEFVITDTETGKNYSIKGEVAPVVNSFMRNIMQTALEAPTPKTPYTMLEDLKNTIRDLTKDDWFKVEIEIDLLEERIYISDETHCDFFSEGDLGLIPYAFTVAGIQKAINTITRHHNKSKVEIRHRMNEEKESSN